jgi:hypothetical protein
MKFVAYFGRTTETTQSTLQVSVFTVRKGEVHISCPSTGSSAMALCLSGTGGPRRAVTPNRASRSSGGFPGRVTLAAGAFTATRFMSARSFFDSNVLVYTDDKASPAKQRCALALVVEHRRACTGVVSLQVLQEYFGQTHRRCRPRD